MADGVEVANRTVNASGNWNYDFGKQPKYNANGKEINYTIVETAVSGYTGSTRKLTDAAGDISFVITNTHTPTPPTPPTPPSNPPTTPPTTPTTPPATPSVQPATRVRETTPEVTVEETVTPTVDPAVLGARRMVLGAKRSPQVLGARRAQTGDAASMAAYGVMSGSSFAGIWAWIVLFLKRKKAERERRARKLAAMREQNRL